MQINSEVITTATSDDLVLNGFLISPSKSDTVIIYIHGFISDPYSHLFPKVIANALKDIGVSTLMAQHRGTGIVTEVLKTNRLDSEILGSFHEKIEDSHIDISAWILKLKELGYKHFYLMGHSLGTIKAIRYLFEGEYKTEIEKLILLAPFDKNWFIVEKAGSEREEHLALAKRMIDEGRGEEYVNKEMEDFLISYKTYYSWYKQDELSNMFDFHKAGEYDFPILSSIKIPTFVAIGSKDEEFAKDFNDYEKVFKKHIPQVSFNTINAATHCFVGYEDSLSTLISNFLEQK